MLVFENNEEIDIRGVTTFGTSVKKSSTAIGFFGTGLKYAIAVLVREGLNIRLYSGNRRYDFEAQEIEMRGEKLTGIVMVDALSKERTELAFTTELGKTWKLWQAYRELYCNTIDENGIVTQVSKAMRGRKGTTRILVEGLDEVHEKRDDFILGSEPLWELNQVDIHPVGDDSKGAIYYRGIRVLEPKKRMLYSYNLKHAQELTEDRTLKHSWAADCAIMRSLIHSTAGEPVKEVLCAGEGTYEHDLNFSFIEGEQPSELFMAVMSSISKTKASHSSYGYYSSYATEMVCNLPRMQLSKEQNEILRQAKDLIAPAGYEDIYGIVVTEVLNGALSKAANQTIWLAPEIFNKPVEIIAEVILDNFVELKHGDKGRSWLIQQLIKQSNQEPEIIGVGEDGEIFDPDYDENGILKQKYEEVLGQIAEIAQDACVRAVKVYVVDISKDGTEPLDFNLVGRDNVKGDKQDCGEGCGYFEHEWVEQWTNGVIEDSFIGNIYLKILEDVYLEIKYRC